MYREGAASLDVMIAVAATEDDRLGRPSNASASPKNRTE